MKLFETKFSFEKVLTIRPSKGQTVHDALADLARHRWHDQQRAGYDQHDENAYATIDTTQREGYVVTIQIQPASINLDQARELYLSTCGVCCPVCQFDQIEGGPIEVDTGEAIQELTCGRCRSTWTDHYTLDRIDALIVGKGGE